MDENKELIIMPLKTELVSHAAVSQTYSVTAEKVYVKCRVAKNTRVCTVTVEI